MNNIGWICVLVVVVGIFLYREWRNRQRLRETMMILEKIMTGNENRRIFVGANEQIAPLVFKINQLVDSYQTEKINIQRTEQARKQLLSNLSHDVRTPLTSVLGYLDALSEGMAGEEANEYLQIARNKAYALKSYLDELFMLAQLDADELKLVSEPVDLFELLRSELIGWIPLLQKKNISLDLNIPDEEVFVMGDPHALTRIFINLLQNAIRHGARSDQMIGVVATADQTTVSFEVWDRGPGLTSEEISRVFERLYKGDSSRATKGHGLGLAIAKDLVQKMDGTIILDSIPDQKTTVRVSLPRSKKK